MIFDVKDLSFKYENKKGINNITFSISAPGVLAIIGANGSGKTTLLKTIIGINHAQHGEVLIDERRIDDSITDDISFLLDTDILIETFTVKEMIDYFIIMKKLGIEKDDLNALLEKYSISGYINEKIKNLSKGIRKRVAIFLTFLGNPKVIILDEPTDGLDTEGMILLKKIIKDNSSIIIITSHMLDFIEKIADSILFIKRGMIEAIGIDEFAKLEEKYIQLK
jgi:hypothetical protein